MKFRSPGVYTKEVDVSGWSVSKNQIRKGKINKVVNLVNSVLGVKNSEPIIAIPIGCINGFVVAYNYDEFSQSKNRWDSIQRYGKKE